MQEIANSDDSLSQILCSAAGWEELEKSEV
jgi:hypothetical protein